VEEQYAVFKSWSDMVLEYGDMIDYIITWHAAAGRGLSDASRKHWDGCTKEFLEV
jgi:hypothetical protein